LETLGAELHRVENRGLRLIDEADPRTAIETLSRWESVLGLTASGNDTQRQTQITSAFSAYGGQTAEYFRAACAAVGIPVTVKTYPEFTPDGVYANPILAAHCFQVIAPDTSTVVLRVGMQCGQPLRAFGVGSPIPYLIDKIKPAHTKAFIAYV
jgi:uncharacterized protein YmfQ (DUF2313 family)